MTLQGDKTKYETYLHSRPRSFEKTAVRMLLDVMRQGMRKARRAGLRAAHRPPHRLRPPAGAGGRKICRCGVDGDYREVLQRT